MLSLRKVHVCEEDMLWQATAGSLAIVTGLSLSYSFNSIVKIFMPQRYIFFAFDASKVTFLNK